MTTNPADCGNPTKRLNLILKGDALRLYESIPAGERNDMVNRAIVAMLDPDNLNRTKALLVQVLVMAEEE